MPTLPVLSAHSCLSCTHPGLWSKSSCGASAARPSLAQAVHRWPSLSCGGRTKTCLHWTAATLCRSRTCCRLLLLLGPPALKARPLLRVASLRASPSLHSCLMCLSSSDIRLRPSLCLSHVLGAVPTPLARQVKWSTPPDRVRQLVHVVRRFEGQYGMGWRRRCNSRWW